MVLNFKLLWNSGAPRSSDEFMAKEYDSGDEAQGSNPDMTWLKSVPLLLNLFLQVSTNI